MKPFLLAAILFSICSLLTHNLEAQTVTSNSVNQPMTKLTVEGNTIAYDSFSDRVLIPGGYQIQTFLFRINKIKKGTENSRHILIHYFHIVGNSLTKEISDSQLTAKFNLERKPDCDSKISDFYYRGLDSTEKVYLDVNMLKPLVGSETEFNLIPIDVTIPCYRLSLAK